MSSLTQILRQLPGPPESIRGAFEPREASALVTASARHGLSVYLRETLAEAQISLPAPHQEALRRHALAATVKAHQVTQLAEASLDALGKAGVIPLFLKGVSLASRLYPTVSARLSTDVDFWVQPSQMKAATQALAGLGLQPEKHGFAPENLQTHHLAFGAATGTVELHFRLLSSFGRPVLDDALWARRREAVFNGRPIYLLSTEDELTYLSLHAMHHLLARLMWLYDLKLLCVQHRETIDWDRLERTAAATGFGSLVYLALSLCHARLNAPLPLERLERLAPAVWKQKLASRIFSPARLEAATLAKHKLVWVATKALLSSDLRMLGHLGWYRLASWFQGSPIVRS